MAKCLNCGNSTNFNIWCTISKVLEVELDDRERLKNVLGEPEEEELQDEEEYWFPDDDLELSMVSCAWCGSRNVIVEKPIATIAGKKSE